NEECSAECFGPKALGQGSLHVGSAAFAAPLPRRPRSLSFFSRLSWSSERNGNVVHVPMRALSRRYASLNARAISAGQPSTPPGSGTPQCAVIGCPGHPGHASPAALSQTVKTKSSAGALGLANSPHDFERKREI